MKHNLKISVSKKPMTGGVVACRSISLRDKLLTFLFGLKNKVMILVPGDSVEMVSITVIAEGGVVHEAV